MMNNQVIQSQPINTCSVDKATDARMGTLGFEGDFWGGYMRHHDPDIGVSWQIFVRWEDDAWGVTVYAGGSRAHEDVNEEIGRIVYEDEGGFDSPVDAAQDAAFALKEFLQEAMSGL